MSCGPPTGQESFFYPPGSVEEHLVTEHGIDSLVVRRQAAGSYDHAGDHSKQRGCPECRGNFGGGPDDNQAASTSS